ncbi:MAG: ABC transporter substrate-binding protein [Azoarcus sp.]|jgi:phospholipid transport system substrate-binding protein|nr:ABC transporter substrate-binding protein [Azoarcus sp.]
MKGKLFAMCLSALTALALYVPAARAVDASTPPDQLVRDVTTDVLNILRTDQNLQSGDNAKVVELINAKVLPHFNFRRMTSLAVGKDWRSATAEQQSRLTEAFRTLLVRTYSNALTQYRNEIIDFKPFRANAGDKQVKVGTEARQPGGQPIPIDYMLENSPQGWKVFDVVVAGVSLVTNYRGNFADEIRTKGIDGLIASIESKNQSLEKK